MIDNVTAVVKERSPGNFHPGEYHYGNFRRFPGETSSSTFLRKPLEKKVSFQTDRYTYFNVIIHLEQNVLQTEKLNFAVFIL